MMRVAVTVLVLMMLAGCSAAAPSASPPSIDLGSVDPCSLLTAAEVSSVLSRSMVQSDEQVPSGVCRWTEDGGLLGLVALGIEDGNLSEVRPFVNDASDLTVGGYPAVFGSELDVDEIAILYVGLGNSRLWVSLPYLPNNTGYDAARQLHVQLAETAVSRLR